MHEINSIDEMNNIIQKEAFTLFYLSREDCGTCGAVKPKVIALAEKYPELKTYEVDLGKNEIIAGQYSIFTIPAVLIYAGGKEAIREARNFSIMELDQKIDRLSQLMA
jgi:thiol-disulfide isomerase/thioredoxin